ncbi:hypothetical protein OKJ48_07610 [Streptomyces kunmingensis]|uniref:Uncharacterized protein n=3 Tax=Streptomyces kunmingensis TaxID=68225 RepID=A0ABU6C5Z6_9ACTN|nr:hypothetical protein [Streptomyces kunmingensis]MEB3960114.1 hypothetical protein [Streptomyces kunmingensis]
MAQRFEMGEVGASVRGGFRADVGDLFARDLGGVMGTDAARSLGQRWAEGFVYRFGKKDLGEALWRSLDDLPAVAGGGLRGALSHGVADALTTDWGRKFSGYAGDAVANVAHQNVSEGTYNLFTTGRFTTSWETGVAGAGAGLLGHMLTRNALSMGAGIRDKLEVWAKPELLAGIRAGGVNPLPGPDAPLNDGANGYRIGTVGTGDPGTVGGGAGAGGDAAVVEGGTRLADAGPAGSGGSFGVSGEAPVGSGSSGRASDRTGAELPGSDLPGTETLTGTPGSGPVRGEEAGAPEPRVLPTSSAGPGAESGAVHVAGDVGRAADGTATAPDGGEVLSGSGRDPVSGLDQGSAPGERPVTDFTAAQAQSSVLMAQGPQSPQSPQSPQGHGQGPQASQRPADAATRRGDPTRNLADTGTGAGQFAREEGVSDRSGGLGGLEAAADHDVTVPDTRDGDAPGDLDAPRWLAAVSSGIREPQVAGTDAGPPLRQATVSEDPAGRDREPRSPRARETTGQFGEPTAHGQPTAAERQNPPAQVATPAPQAGDETPAQQAEVGDRHEDGGTAVPDALSPLYASIPPAERAQALEQWSAYRAERDAFYEQRLSAEERFQRVAGDVSAEVGQESGRFARTDLFGGRYAQSGGMAREHAESSYREELRRVHEDLTRRAGPAGVSAEQWRAAHDRVREDMPRFLARGAERERHAEIFHRDFDRTVSEFRATDPFGGLYLPAEETPGARSGQETPETAPDREIQQEDLLEEAEKTDVPHSLQQIRARMQLRYLRAVDEVYRTGGDGLPGDERYGQALDERIDALREELADQVAQLSERERHIEQHARATRRFDDALEQWQDDIAGGGLLDEASQAKARADFQQELRTVHRALRRASGADRPAFALRWGTYLDRSLTESALRERFMYAEVREQRMAQARTFLTTEFDRFENRRTSVEELHEAGRERVLAQWDKVVEKAIDEDWFGHQGRHDFRVPPTAESLDAAGLPEVDGARESAFPAEDDAWTRPLPTLSTDDPRAQGSRRSAGSVGRQRDAGTRSWRDAFDDLRATVELRLQHEAELQGILHHTARDFHNLVGHPDSLVRRYDVDEETLGRLGGDFRYESITRYDAIWARTEHDIEAWLRHERRHENGFEETLSTARGMQEGASAAHLRAQEAAARSTPLATDAPTPPGTRPGENNTSESTDPAPTVDSTDPSDTHPSDANQSDRDSADVGEAVQRATAQNRPAPAAVAGPLAEPTRPASQSQKRTETQHLDTQDQLVQEEPAAQDTAVVGDLTRSSASRANTRSRNGDTTREISTTPTQGHLTSGTDTQWREHLKAQVVIELSKATGWTKRTVGVEEVMGWQRELSDMQRRDPLKKQAQTIADRVLSGGEQGRLNGGAKKKARAATEQPSESSSTAATSAQPQHQPPAHLRAQEGPAAQRPKVREEILEAVRSTAAWQRLRLDQQKTIAIGVDVTELIPKIAHLPTLSLATVASAVLALHQANSNFREQMLQNPYLVYMAMKRPLLMRRFLNDGVLLERMSSAPAVSEQLTQVIHLWDDTYLEKSVSILRREEVVRELESDFELRRAVFVDAWNLLAHFDGNLGVLRNLIKVTTGLTRLGHQSPEFGSAVLQANDPVEALWNLGSEVNLVEALLTQRHRGRTGSIEFYRTILENDRIRSILRHNPERQNVLLSDERLLSIAQSEPASIRHLSRPQASFLTDVLEDLPELAVRLLSKEEFISAAIDNAHVAAALSSDPHHYDKVDDDNLSAALASTRDPSPQQENRRVPAVLSPAEINSKRPIELLSYIRQMNAAAETVLGSKSEADKKLALSVMGRESLIRIWAHHPTLPRYPHSVRRMLHPKMEKIQLPADPKAALMALQLASRHEAMYEKFDRGQDLGAIEAFSSELTINPGFFDAIYRNPGLAYLSFNLQYLVRPELLTFLKANPWLGAAVERSPNVEYVLRVLRDISHLKNLEPIKNAASFGDLDATDNLASLLHPTHLAILNILRDRAIVRNKEDLEGLADRIWTAFTAGNSSFLRIVHRSPESVNGFDGEDWLTVLSHLMIAPDVPSILLPRSSEVTAGHWKYFFFDGALLRAIGRQMQGPMVDELTTRAEVLREAVARPAFVKAWEDDPQKFDALATQISEADGEDLDPARGLLAAIRDTGQRHVAADGFLIDDEERVHQVSLLVGSIVRGDTAAAAEQLLRENGEQTSDLRSVLSRYERILADGRLKKAVVSSETYALGAFFYERVAELTEVRPSLLDLFERSPMVLHQVMKVRNLADLLIQHDESFIAFTMDDSLRQNFNNYYVEVYKQNPNYLKVFEAYSQSLLLPRNQNFDHLMRRSVPAAEAVLRSRSAYTELIRSPELVAVLGSAPDSVVRAVLATEGRLSASAHDVNLVAALQGVPGLAKILGERPEVAGEARAWRNLLENSRLLSKLVEYPGLMADVVTKKLLPVVSVAPEFVDVLNSATDGVRSGLTSQAVLDLIRAKPAVAQVLMTHDGLRAAVVGLRGMAELLRADPSSLPAFLRSPELIEAVRANRILIDVASAKSGVWLVIQRHPVLAGFLNQSRRKFLEKHTGVMSSLLRVDKDFVVEHAEVLVRAIARRGFASLLEEHTDFARMFWEQPLWWGRVAGDAEFTDTVRQLVRENAPRFEELVAAADVTRLLAAIDESQRAARGTGAVYRNPDMSQSAVEIRVEAGSVAERVDPGSRVPGSSGSRVDSVVVLPVEVVDLLADRAIWGEGSDADAGVGVGGALERHPGLLPLLIGAPSAAEDVHAHPDRVAGYVVDEFLDHEAPAGSFGRQFDEFLGSVDIALDDDSYKKVSAAGALVWRGVVEEREGRLADERAVRAGRFQAFRPADARTWEHSGRVHYPVGRLGSDAFTDLQHSVLDAIAGSGTSVRESHLAINVGLHAHLDGGSGGVAFFFALAADGLVDTVVYAKSVARSGNQYRWGGSGQYVDGPPSLEVVANAAELVKSRDLVARRQVLGRVEAVPVARSGAGYAVLEPAVEARARDVAAGSKAVSEAVTEYHAALDALSSAARRAKKDKALKSRNAAGRLVGAGMRLRALGADVFTRGWETVSEATSASAEKFLKQEWSAGQGGHDVLPGWSEYERGAVALATEVAGESGGRAVARHLVAPPETPRPDVAPSLQYRPSRGDDVTVSVESGAGIRLWRFSGADPATVLGRGFPAGEAPRDATLYEWARDTPDAGLVPTPRDRQLWHGVARYRYQVDADSGSAPVSVFDALEHRTGEWDTGAGEVRWRPGDWQAPADASAPVHLSWHNTLLAGAAADESAYDETAADPLFAPGLGPVWGFGQVRTDRWTPFGGRGDESGRGPEAFVFTPGGNGTRPRVTRPARSGERTEVGYDWAWHRRSAAEPGVLRVTRRIHLRPEGVSRSELSAVRAAFTLALEQVVNLPGYRLPPLQPGNVPGPRTVGPNLFTSVEFVDSAEEAHGTVTVRSGLPDTERGMVQDVWFTGVHPAAYVHEYLHGLGVLDDLLAPEALLRPGNRGEQAVPEGLSSVMGPMSGRTLPSELFLTPDHLRQINDVLLPHVHAGGQAVSGQVVPARAPLAASPRSEVDVAPSVPAGWAALYPLVHGGRRGTAVSGATMPVATHPDDDAHHVPGSRASDPLPRLRTAWQQLSDIRDEQERTEHLDPASQQDLNQRLGSARALLTDSGLAASHFLTGPQDALEQGVRRRERLLSRLESSVTQAEAKAASGSRFADRLADLREFRQRLLQETATIRTELDRRTEATRASQSMVPGAREIELARFLAMDEYEAERQFDLRAAALTTELGRVDVLRSRGGKGADGYTEMLRRHQRHMEEDRGLLRAMRSRDGLRHLTDAQRTALVLVERKAQELVGREREIVRQHLAEGDWTWAAGYPTRGEELDQLLDRVHEHLRDRMELVTNFDLGREVRGGTLLQALTGDADGLFRNYWETQSSQAQMNSAMRGTREESMGYAALLGRDVTLGGTFQSRTPNALLDEFNPSAEAVRQLPKYAALVSRLQQGGATEYGNAVFHWKKDVASRITLTPRDSWLEGAQGVRGVTSRDHLFPLLAHGDEDPVRLAFAEATGFVHDPELREQLSAGMFDQRGYFEAQIHGDLSWSDVEEIVLRHSGEDEAVQLGRRLTEFAEAGAHTFRVRLSRIGVPQDLSDPETEEHESQESREQDQWSHTAVSKGVLPPIPAGPLPVIPEEPRAEEAAQLPAQEDVPGSAPTPGLLVEPVVGAARPAGAVPVEELFAGAWTAHAGDRPLALWLPGPHTGTPDRDRATLAALPRLVPEQTVLVFGEVREGALFADGRPVTAEGLASLITAVTGGMRAPLLTMPGADQVAPQLSEILGTPVIASRYGMEIDLDAGTLSEADAPEGLENGTGFRLFEGQRAGSRTYFLRRQITLETPTDSATAFDAAAQERTPPTTESSGTPSAPGYPIDVDPMVRSIGVPRAGLPYLIDVVARLRVMVEESGQTVSESYWDSLPQRLLSNYRYLVPGEGDSEPSGLMVPLGRVEALVTLDPRDPHAVSHVAGAYDRSWLRQTEDPDSVPSTDAQAHPQETEASPGPVGLVPDRPAGPERFHANETINASYLTGAQVQSHSGPTGATRGGLSMQYVVAPGVYLSAGVSGVANSSFRSTTKTGDAEGGHVEDTRADSTMIAYRPDWSLRVRTDRKQPWREITPTEVRPQGEQRLLLYVPDHYLQSAPDQIVATGTGDLAHRLPAVHYASGLTNLPQLFDHIEDSLSHKGYQLPLGSVTRNELLQKLWNLDSHLDDAVNKEEGYRFSLHDGSGRPIAVVELHSKRLQHSRRVGSTSDVAHVENVRTAIDGTGGTHTVNNSTTLTVPAVTLDISPASLAHPDLGLGVSASLAMTWGNSDSISSGRTGLWVVVPRYTGFTAGYRVEFEHSAVVAVRGGGTLTTSPVSGQGLVRMPEPLAFRYGFQVDEEALRDDQVVGPSRPLITDSATRIEETHGAGGAAEPTTARTVDEPAITEITDPEEIAALAGRDDIVRPFEIVEAGSVTQTAPETSEHTMTIHEGPLGRTVEYRPDLLRAAGRRPGDPEHLEVPPHVAQGRGIGMGLVDVDEETVRELHDRVAGELQRLGFLPADTRAPLAGGHWYSHGNQTDSRLSNLNMLEKYFSARGMESHFDQIHQDGLVLTMYRRRGIAGIDLDVDAVKITLKASGSSELAPRFEGSTAEFHTVNLAMGMDTAGQSTGGSTKAGLSFRFKSLFNQLKGSVTGVDLIRQIGATEGVSYLNNRPELLEYPGVVNKHRLFSDYTVTMELQHSGVQGEIRKGTRNPGPIRLEGQGALAYLLPLGDVSRPGKPGLKTLAQGQDTPGRTPASVLDRAVVYYVDATGLHEAATSVLTPLIGPQGNADQELHSLTNTIQVKAHFKEIAHGQLTTDQPFSPGWFRDTFGMVNLRAELGPVQFAGATPDKFVLGIIMLSLLQTNTSDTGTTGLKWVQADVTAGGPTQADDPGSTGAVQGTADAGRTWQRNISSSEGRTGGKELIQLDFNRGYAFRTTVDYFVANRLEKHSKLLPEVHHVADEAETKVSNTALFLLSEPEALEQYGKDLLPVSDEQLVDVMNRWNKGEARLSGNTVAAVLSRWVRETATLPDDLPAPLDAERTELAHSLARLHENGGLPVLDDTVRNTFNGRFGTELESPAEMRRKNPLIELNDFNDIQLPEYLTRDDDGGRTLGHSGIHDLNYQDGRTTYDIVREQVEKTAPGLLASDPELWTAGGRRIGRVQGGVNSLQALLAKGRDMAMWDEFLSPNGHALYLVNPIGWLLTDIVEIKLSDVLEGAPQIYDFRPGTGIEVYGHGYVSQSQGSSRDGIQSFTPLKFGGSETNAFNSASVGFGQGHHRSVTRAENAVTEQTIYDWNANYLARFRHTLTAEVRRLDMAGRPLNNLLAGWYRAGEPTRSAVNRTSVSGLLDLQVPRGLAEFLPEYGPSLPRDLRPLPPLPGDAYVTGTMLDDGLPAAMKLMRQLFGPEADGAVTRTSQTLRQLMGRAHQTNHILQASAGNRYLLTDKLHVPGRSSTRARLYMRGDLFDLEVLGPVKGTGAGRYIKHQSGTTAGQTTDRWRPSANVNSSATGAIHQPEPGTDGQPIPPYTAEGSTVATRVTAGSAADAGTENYRREQHVKQQGPLQLVRMRGRYRLEAERYARHLLWPSTRQRGIVRSDAFTGDVYVQLFQAEVEELRARLEEREQRASRGDLGWLELEEAPRFDLASLLRDAGRTRAASADRAHQTVARLIRQQSDGAFDGVVLTLDSAAHLTNASQQQPPPVSTPPSLSLYGLPHDYLVRDLAHELDVHVRLDINGGDGTVRQRWADPSGHVYAFDPLDPGADSPARGGLTAADAEGAGLITGDLREKADELGFDKSELGEIYRTSWQRRRSFADALSVEVSRRQARLDTDPRLASLYRDALRLAEGEEAPVRTGQDAGFALDGLRELARDTEDISPERLETLLRSVSDLLPAKAPLPERETGPVTAAVPVEYEERLRLAFRISPDANLAATHIERELLEAGTGARALVLPEFWGEGVGSPLYAVNLRHRVRWSHARSGVLMSAPQSDAGLVSWMSVDAEGKMINPPSELSELGDEATHFPELSLGNDLLSVLGLVERVAPRPVAAASKPVLDSTGGDASGGVAERSAPWVGMALTENDITNGQSQRILRKQLERLDPNTPGHARVRAVLDTYERFRPTAEPEPVIAMPVPEAVASAHEAVTSTAEVVTPAPEAVVPPIATEWLDAATGRDSSRPATWGSEGTTLVPEQGRTTTLPDSGFGTHGGGFAVPRVDIDHGIPEKNVSRFRKLSSELNLVLEVRPTDPHATAWLDKGALPKPEAVKAKPLDALDVHLGADERNLGLVGYFSPTSPQRTALMDDSLWDEIQTRGRRRLHEYRVLAPEMAALAERFPVVDGVVHGYSSEGELRPLTSDHDIFDIYTPGGSPLTLVRDEGAVGAMKAGRMGVEHGALTYWKPETSEGRHISEEVNRNHASGREPVVVFRPGEELQVTSAASSRRGSAHQAEEISPTPSLALADRVTAQLMGAAENKRREVLVRGELNRLALEAVAERVVRDAANNDCVTLLAEFLTQIQPQREPYTGVRAAGSVDDSVIGLSGAKNTIIPGAAWNRISSWSHVADSLRRESVRASAPAVALIIWRRGSGADFLQDRTASIGHAFAAVAEPDGRTWWLELQRASGNRVSVHAPARDALHAEAVVVSLGRVSPDALLMNTDNHSSDVLDRVSESESTARSIVDKPLDLRIGAMGFEVESSIVLDSKESDGWFYADDLVLSKNVVITTDKFRDEWVAEVVTRPINALSGESEWAQREHVFGDVVEVFRRLKKAKPGTPLAKIFPRGDGFSLTKEGESARRGPELHEGRLSIHMTVGVPLVGLGPLLELTAERTMFKNAPGHVNLQGGREFADRVVRRLPQEIRNSKSDLDALHGYTWLLYTQVAAVAYTLLSESGLDAKKLSQVASRTSMSALRESLSRPVREFLRDEGGRIIDKFVTQFLKDNGQDPDLYLEGKQGEPAVFLARSKKGFSILDYLKSALFEEPSRGSTAAINQRVMMGVGTYFEKMDDHHGTRSTVPLAVIELRAYGDFDRALVRGWNTYESELSAYYKEIMKLAQDADSRAWREEVDKGRPDPRWNTPVARIDFAEKDRLNISPDSSGPLDDFLSNIMKEVWRRRKENLPGLTIHVEGGGNGSDAVKTGMERAKAVELHLRNLLARFADRWGPDFIPTVRVTSRGKDPSESRMRLVAPAGAVDRQARRSVVVWSTVVRGTAG